VQISEKEAPLLFTTRMSLLSNEVLKVSLFEHNCNKDSLKKGTHEIEIFLKRNAIFLHSASFSVVKETSRLMFCCSLELLTQCR